MEKKCPIRSKYLPFSVFEYAILSYNHDKREMVIASADSFPRKGLLALKSVLEVVWESGSEWYRNLVGNGLRIRFGMVWQFDWDWDYMCHGPLERSKAHKRNCISKDVDAITQPLCTLMACISTLSTNSCRLSSSSAPTSFCRAPMSDTSQETRTADTSSSILE